MRRRTYWIAIVVGIATALSVAAQAPAQTAARLSPIQIDARAEAGRDVINLKI